MRARRFLTRLTGLVLAAALLLCLAGCEPPSAQAILDDGADRFSQGKDEENYYLKNSGALLEELIDSYSGSYQIPTGTPMTDDEYEDAIQQITGDTDPDPGTPDPGTSDPGAPDPGTSDPGTSDPGTPDPGTPDPGTTDPGTPDPGTSDPGASDPSGGSQDDGIPDVSTHDELLRVFHNAYDATAEYLRFQLTDGFTFDPNVELEQVYIALQREDPIDVCSVGSWSWYIQDNEYFISINYLIDVDELISMKAATPQLVEQAVSQIDVGGGSDYEIVCAVNEYLCDTVYYPPNEPYAPITHTAYGALADGCAVCEGYACAAKLLLNRLGVLCDIQVGFCTDGGGHAWNLAQVDGDWYQLDVTWNDGDISDRTDYLLVTDDYMRKSRSWEEVNYPATPSEPYSQP